MEKTNYNGWTNYETWNCKLWIDNDEGEYEYWKDQARRAKNAYNLSKELESYYDERAEEFMGNQSGFFADILNAALHEVNWYEIAEHLYQENHETEEEEA